MSTGDESKLALYGLIGGPIALQWGLARLRAKRLIENTPRSRVRSAATGLVELQGSAQPINVLKAPVSKLDVCWWRCRVQRLRRTQRRAEWVTVKDVSSNDLFVLEDPTGRVLIDPQDAEMQVRSYTVNLNSSTSNQLTPTLAAWGLSPGFWLGTESTRVIEDSIPQYAPLFILGELTRLAGHRDSRQERFQAKMKAIKADSAQMAGADENKDGAISAEEWDAFRSKQEEIFLRDEISRQPESPETEALLVKAPLDRPYLIATKSEKDVIGTMAWQIPLALAGGVGASAFGFWLAMVDHWTLWSAAASLACGLLVGAFLGQLKGAKSWVSLWW